MLLLLGAGAGWLIGLPSLTVLLTLTALLYLSIFATMVRRDRRVTTVPLRPIHHNGGLPKWVLDAMNALGDKLLSETANSVVELKEHQGGFLRVTSFDLSVVGGLTLIDENAKLGKGDQHAFIYRGKNRGDKRTYHLFVLVLDDSMPAITPLDMGATCVSVIYHPCTQVPAK